MDRLRKLLYGRFSHLFNPVSAADAALDLDGVDEHTKKKCRRSKQALWIKKLALFDVNECEMERLHLSENKEAFVKLLCDEVASELKFFLKDEFDAGAPYAIHPM